MNSKTALCKSLESSILSRKSVSLCCPKIFFGELRLGLFPEEQPITSLQLGVLTRRNQLILV